MKTQAINHIKSIIMKKSILIISCLFITTISFAQSQSINYKAIIKDGSGNLVVNQMIGVQFTILSNAVNVYKETHPVTTDNNGLIMLKIGTGNTTDVYSDVDWKTLDHTLNVQVDTGSGLVDMGTTQLMSVPYAHVAGNVSGLETLDEGNGVGYRLKDKDATNYGDIGENAVDLSNSESTSTTYGAIGNYSTALGNITTASGFGSMSLGVATKAESYYSMAIGALNIGGGNPISWDPIDPLFEVGNGFSTPSNAFTILKNGKVGVGEHQPSGFLEVKATNTPNQPNINIVHQGTTGARINFSNTDTTNGNVWTLYGDTNDTDANSVFNIFHPNAGNIVKIKGDGQVDIKGDLSVTGSAKIGVSGVAISEVIKLTGLTYRAQGQSGDVGSNSIPYPSGYDWENTYVVSFKVKSRVGGGQGGINWYTTSGNYNSGDDQSIHIDLGYDPNPANPAYIKLKISDPQYEGAAYVLILMKID